MRRILCSILGLLVTVQVVISLPQPTVVAQDFSCASSKEAPPRAQPRWQESATDDQTKCFVIQLSQSRKLTINVVAQSGRFELFYSSGRVSGFSYDQKSSVYPVARQSYYQLSFPRPGDGFHTIGVHAILGGAFSISIGGTRPAPPPLPTQPPSEPQPQAQGDQELSYNPDSSGSGDLQDSVNIRRGDAATLYLSDAPCIGHIAVSYSIAGKNGRVSLDRIGPFDVDNGLSGAVLKRSNRWFIVLENGTPASLNDVNAESQAVECPPPTPRPTIRISTAGGARCSQQGKDLSNLCIKRFPSGPGDSADVWWRITDYGGYGAFDKGDGQGFAWQINHEMEINVPNVTQPRRIQLRWTDSRGQTYVDSLWLVFVPGDGSGSGAPATATSPVGSSAAGQPAFAPQDTFPCSRQGIKVSNLCIKAPYPVKRGATATVIWRIDTDFQSGELDMSDGRGFTGPILKEWELPIPNITAPRLVRLRWVDKNGTRHEDSMTIAVVD